MNDELKDFISNLKTQDNRSTHLPIFFVQREVTEYGYSKDYSDEYIWIESGDEVYDDDIIKEYEEISEDYTKDLPSGVYKCYYKKKWENVQPFFTEVAAQRYIDCNGHNLGKTRIYVESGYRNREWEMIREYFLNYEKTES